MINIDKVKLKVGEETTIYGVNREPFRFSCPDCIEINEIFHLNGRYWVTHDIEPILSGVKNYYKFSRVFIASVPHAPINEAILSVGTKNEHLPPVQDVLKRFIEEAYKRGDIFPLINGVFIPRSKKEEIKEPIRGGQDFISIGKEGQIDARLHRYVPATEENRKKLEEVFGKVF